MDPFFSCPGDIHLEWSYVHGIRPQHSEVLLELLPIQYFSLSSDLYVDMIQIYGSSISCTLTYVKKSIRLEISPCQFLSHPAKAFRCDTQIRGHHPLGYTHQNIRVQGHKIQISFFSIGTNQQIDPVLQLTYMVVQEVFIVISIFGTDSRSFNCKL